MSESKRQAERVSMLGELRAEVMVFQAMLVREISRGNVDVPKMAEHLEAWGLPKESDL